MDLDEQELKATREKSADELFTELGYKKEEMSNKWGRVWGISYKNEEYYIKISLDMQDKEVCIGTSDRDSEPVYIGMDELQAINKKCKELGWL